MRFNCNGGTDGSWTRVQTGIDYAFFVRSANFEFFAMSPFAQATFWWGVNLSTYLTPKTGRPSYLNDATYLSDRTIGVTSSLIKQRKLIDYYFLRLYLTFVFT